MIKNSGQFQKGKLYIGLGSMIGLSAEQLARFTDGGHSEAEWNAQMNETNRLNRQGSKSSRGRSPRPGGSTGRQPLSARARLRAMTAKCTPIARQRAAEAKIPERLEKPDLPRY